MYFMFIGRRAYKYLGSGGWGGGLYYKRQYTSIRYFGRRGICRQFGRIAVKRHKTA